MDLTTFLFWTIALTTGGCAVAVVVTQNIVRCAIWLLFALAGTSGIFFLLGADFVGATQLFVYVGGTLVLVVFGVMLTAQGPFVSLKAGAAEWAIATVVGLLLYGMLAAAVLTGGFYDSRELSTLDAAKSPTSAVLGEALLGLTSTSYLLPFEIVSVHLLVVLIGAAYLARAKRRRGAAP